jgi:hypothetical protein
LESRLKIAEYDTDYGSYHEKGNDDHISPCISEAIPLAHDERLTIEVNIFPAIRQTARRGQAKVRKMMRIQAVRNNEKLS